MLLLVWVGGGSVLTWHYLTMLEVINCGSRDHDWVVIIFRCLMVIVLSIAASAPIVIFWLHKLLLRLELGTLHHQIVVIVALVIVLIQILLMCIVFVQVLLMVILLGDYVRLVLSMRAILVVLHNLFARVVVGGGAFLTVVFFTVVLRNSWWFSIVLVFFAIVAVVTARLLVLISIDWTKGCCHWHCVAHWLSCERLL